jgi:hypothetical protein
VAVVTAPEVTAFRLSCTACLIEVTTESIWSWETLKDPVTSQFCTVSRPVVTRAARSVERQRRWMQGCRAQRRLQIAEVVAAAR